MKTYSFQAMGSRILLAMDTRSDRFSDLAKEVVDQFEAWEQIFSRFRLTSELSEVNRQSGQWVHVSETFWQGLQLSLKVKELTHQLVRPDLLNALENAGYSVSFEELAAHADEWMRQPVFSVEEDAELNLNETTHSLYLPRGMRLDLGGVVKGWAAQQTALHLQEEGAVLVDAGGDIAVSGLMQTQEAWPVGVANPFDAAQNLRLVMMGAGGLATSGRDYRRWQKNGQWQHHIIDPRIDRPAETDILSATVLAPDLVTAEAYAKMGLILGSEAAIETYRQIDDLGYFLVLENGTQLSNSFFDQKTWNEQWMNQQNKISA